MCTRCHIVSGLDAGTFNWRIILFIVFTRYGAIVWQYRIFHLKVAPYSFLKNKNWKIQFKHQNICIKSYLHDIICRIRMLHTSKRRFSTFTINIHYSRSNNCIRENANGTIRTVVSCRFCGIVWSTCGKSTRYCGCCNAMATVTLQDRQSFNLIWLKKVRWPAPPDFSNWGRPQSPISPPGRTMEGHWTIYIYIYTWKDNCSPNHWTTKWSPNWPTWRPFWMSVSGPTRLF